MKDINLKYLIITVFVISWIGVLPSLLIAYDVAIPAPINGLELLMTLGPIIGAIIFIYKAQKGKGLKTFFSRLLRFKVPILVILVAIFVPVFVSFFSAYIGLNLSGSPWPESFTLVGILVNGLIIFLMYLIINTEELVWRGIVFDRFLDKYGYFKSCLFLIPIWWLFHIPLFLFPDGHQAGYGLLEFTCIVAAQTFILGWIYVNSNRSLFYVHIHHQLINGFGQAFPIFPIFIQGDKMPIWVFCTLLLLMAVVLIFNNVKREVK